MPPQIPQIDDTRVFSAILASGVKSPTAIEQGSELVDALTSACAAGATRYRTFGLEVGWFIALDERTFCVGAVDKLAVERSAQTEFDPEKFDPFVCERKTTSSSKTWTCDRWLENLNATSQIAMYGWALRDGTFLVDGEEKYLGVESPRILAQAITKSKPPQVWPDENGAFLTVSSQRIAAIKSTCVNVAAAIRAQRATGLVPWQIPDFHCELTFGFTKRKCSAWRTCHETLDYPRSEGRPLGLSPGSTTVVDHLIMTGRIDVDKAEEYVVISNSSLKSFQQCGELWRQESVGATRQDDNEAMDIGTVLHAGVAEFDRILKEAGY